MNRTWLRWTPALVVPVVVVAGAIAIPSAADASPKLEPKTAQQLLESVAGSADLAYSGTIEQTSDLGLPELPSTGDTADAANALELLTGSHQARVFVGGDSTERIQVIDRLAERDVIRNGSDVWLYGSKKNEATHLTLPEHSADGPAALADGTPTTPAELAQKLIDAADPTTDIAVTDTARVAGRPVYQLVLTPDTDATLVQSVTLAVDAETGLPLQVSVLARGQNDPAFEIGFTSIDLGAPDASLFDFTPPAGATVTEKTAPTRAADHAEAPTAGAEPTVTGEGWAAIVEASAPDQAASADTGLLDQLTTTVDGGRALETSLLSVLLTDDGRVLVGSVPVSALQAAAAG